MKPKKTSFHRRWPLFYASLCLLRILGVFFSQACIHPDEYLQGIEVFASRSFGFEAHVPWEFDVKFPLRSVGPQYFTVGLSYAILRSFDMFLNPYFGSFVNAYTLVYVPRLIVCLLSFLCDYSIYRICSYNNEKYKSKLLIFSSSFVTLVFGNRTFSNTLELILFSILLCLVSESMIRSNVIIKHDEYLRKRYEKSKTPSERAKFHKLRLFLDSHNLKNVFLISTVSVLGFFNRPTFIFFSIFPIFFWINRGLGFKSVSNFQFHLRTLFLILSAIPISFFMVLIDSFFYGYISWGEIGMLDVSMNSFVIPGLNFIKYNLNNSHEHGLHPRYLHILINFPMLFNILAIYFFIMLIDFLTKLLKRKFHLLPTIRSIKGLMITSTILPIILLSYVPHQEPRFLIPLINPLVYLFADKIHEEPESAVVEASSESANLKPQNSQNSNLKKSNLILKIWVTSNLIFGLFFGLIHQGSIIPATQFISNRLAENPKENFLIATSHIYNISKSLLRQQNDFEKKKFSPYSVSNLIELKEYGSEDVSFVISDLIRKKFTHREKFKTYLLIPSSRPWDALYEYDPNVRVEIVKTFYPHLSTEALPDFTGIFELLTMKNVKDINFRDFIDCFSHLIRSFGLHLCEVTVI